MAMTTATAATTSATMDMDMGGTSPSSDMTGMMMNAADMSMVFFQSVTTPLYWSAWKPAGVGSYAGTCIFLVVLAAIHRCLLALRSMFLDTRLALHSPSDRELGNDKDAATSGSKGPYRLRWSRHPFQAVTETTCALAEVVIGGIGYLLMVAAMTMNVGYFLSVLTGIFVGTFFAGRFRAIGSRH
ncbi:Ctr copper transporter family-domain-containing protein [Xylariaceae sp. FL1651]|nr:Ctr copper transporter family-domain-containing protein [Xylariaceae sp. FL1651]